MPKTPTLKLGSFKNFLIALFTILVLTITSLNLYLFINRKPTVLGIQVSPLSERQYWQRVARNTPTYRDAWVQIAKIDSEMGNRQYAQVALNRAKNIDPNSTTILDVEKNILK